MSGSPNGSRHDLNSVPLTVLSSGLDWVTATARTETHQLFMATLGTKWLRDQEAAGYEVTPMACRGYTGMRVEGVTVGTRADGVLVRLSGPTAHQHGDQLIRLADHVSRIDYEVTTRDTAAALDWADAVASKLREDLRIASGRTSLTHVQDNAGGHTLYIGRRISDRFFRVYNKTAESKGEWPAGAWRFEVEYKGRRAETHAARIAAEKWHAYRAADAVWSAFRDYGVELPFPYIGADHRDFAPRRQTDDEKRLRYLGTVVRPMVRKLRDAYGAATLREVLQLDDNDAIENA
jgi:hypothetical protein